MASRRSVTHQLRQLCNVDRNATRLTFGEQLSFSQRVRRLVKQFELRGQHRDTQVRLVVREVRFKCVELVSGFR